MSKEIVKGLLWSLDLLNTAISAFNENVKSVEILGVYDHRSWGDGVKWEVQMSGDGVLDFLRDLGDVVKCEFSTGYERRDEYAVIRDGVRYLYVEPREETA